MKIVTFSDIHGQQNKKLTNWFESNPADLLIFAGDLQANQTTDDGTKFTQWLHKLPYPSKIMVFGNHDGYYDIITNYVVNNFYDDIVILNNNSYTYNKNGNEINIFGSPHSVEFGSWWFMLKDEELEKLWEKIPDNTDILITHGPPYGILDKTYAGINAGSKTLAKRIAELKKLKYHIFGHIHEAFGTVTIGQVTYLNTSLLNERYKFVNNPIIIDYAAGTTETDYNVGE
jgi:Icc-related predicted phosphoesterase